MKFNTRWALLGGIALTMTTSVAMAAALLPFRSTFEAGDFREWDGGRLPTMTVVATDAAVGTRSVQSVLTPGTPTDSYQDFYFGDHPSIGGAPVTPATGLWLVLYSKFDTGFQFSDAASMHKIVLLNFNDENSRRRYQVIINVQPSTRNYYVEHLKWNADGSFNRAFANFPQNVGTAVQPRMGQWDKLKLFVRPNVPGQTNGAVQLWVNGVLKADYANVQIREDSPYNPNKLILSSYESGGRASGIQRWDDFYLGETDPDAGVRPRAPVLDEVR